MPNPRSKAGTRCIALIGPYGSGKTLLLESIAAVTGAVTRKGSVSGGTSLGDFSAEARARQMSVELNVLTTQYLDEDFTFLDCPGSIEFLADTLNVLPGDRRRGGGVRAGTRESPDAAALSEAAVGREDSPSICSSTRSTRPTVRCARCWRMLQDASETPLLLRQIPIWENGVATGFVDLALERAFVYRPHAPVRSDRHRRHAPREGSALPDAGTARRL